jgi:hypothetical protein
MSYSDTILRHGAGVEWVVGERVPGVGAEAVAKEGTLAEPVTISWTWDFEAMVMWIVIVVAKSKKGAYIAMGRFHGSL